MKLKGFPTLFVKDACSAPFHFGQQVAFGGAFLPPAATMRNIVVRNRAAAFGMQAPPGGH
jgi:hypothetical protein